MSVTKRHCFIMFARGWSIDRLCAEYGVTVEWIESAIRKYWTKL